MYNTYELVDAAEVRMRGVIKGSCLHLPVNESKMGIDELVSVLESLGYVVSRTMVRKNVVGISMCRKDDVNYAMVDECDHWLSTHDDPYVVSSMSPATMNYLRKVGLDVKMVTDRYSNTTWEVSAA